MFHCNPVGDETRAEKEILGEEKKAFVLGAGGEVDTKDRERATKKEWEEKLESFAAGSFQLSWGQWPPKGSERANTWELWAMSVHIVDPRLSFKCTSS